jgi:hypothetical protein
MLTGQFAYEESRHPTHGTGFYPLLMAALRVADTENYARIRMVFPDVVAELEARYNAPGGVLTAEQEAEIEALRRPPVQELVSLSVPEGPGYVEDIDDEEM